MQATLLSDSGVANERMTTGGHMSIQRICLIGSLALIGACSMARVQHSIATTPAAAAIATPAAVPTTATVAAVPVSEAMPAAAAAVIPAASSSPPEPVPAPAPAAAARVALKKPVTEAVVAAPVRVQINGHVNLTAGRGQQIEPGDQTDTLVYYVPASGGARVRPGQFNVYTHNRDFSPEALAVPLGSTVTFVNLDDVRHNVFSVTPGSAFDLGYQGSGEKASHVFSHAGIVLVSCNVHRSMELDVLVVPSPYSAKVAADGNFTLRGLPPGPGTLHFWNPRAQPASQALTLPLGGAVKQTLQVTRPRMTMAPSGKGAV